MLKILHDGVQYHVPDSHDTEGSTVTSNSFLHGSSILSSVIGIYRS